MYPVSLFGGLVVVESQHHFCMSLLWRFISRWPCAKTFYPSCLKLCSSASACLSICMLSFCLSVLSHAYYMLRCFIWFCTSFIIQLFTDVINLIVKGADVWELDLDYKDALLNDESRIHLCFYLSNHNCDKITKWESKICSQMQPEKFFMLFKLTFVKEALFNSSLDLLWCCCHWQITGNVQRPLHLFLPQLSRIIWVQTC